MTQLTLRGFDSELERELRKVARTDGISLNQAALRLLRKGAGLAVASAKPIGDALDAFLGTLSDADADAVEEAVRRADAGDLAARAKRK